MGKPEIKSGDEEMDAIRQQQDDMINAAMREGMGKENYDIIEDIHSVRVNQVRMFQVVLDYLNVLN